MRTESGFASVVGGVILAVGLCGTQSSPAAERKPARSAATGDKGFGIVTAKTDKDITIKAEGEDEAKRYLLAPQGAAPKADLQAALKIVFPTNLVMFQSQGDRNPVLTGIQAIHSKTRFGMSTGTVVAVDADPKWPTFDVKPSGRGPTERYVAVWNPATKSVDQRLSQIIAGLKVGDKLKVAWFYDERKRATQIQITAKANVDRSLQFIYRPGMTADVLYDHYMDFGDDPFIRSDDPACVFSAWTYAQERCPAICQAASAGGAAGSCSP